MEKLAFVAIVAVLSFQPIAQSADPKADAKAVEGTWLPTSLELGGAKMQGDQFKGLQLILADGKYTLKTPQGDDKGTYTIDATKSPKHLDIKGTEGPNKGKSFLCIYELGGDTLRVCYDLSGTTRPSEFKTKPMTQLFLAEYKRAKK